MTRETTNEGGKQPPDEEELFQAAESLANYLSVLLAVEYDIDVIDRIAKARKLEDFAEGVYNALRRRENLEQKIKSYLGKLIEQKVENESKKNLEKALKYIESFDSYKVQALIGGLRAKNSSQLKLIASYIGSVAISFNATVRAVRDIFERGSIPREGVSG